MTIKSEQHLNQIVDTRVANAILIERTRNAFIDACRNDVHTMLVELLAHYKDQCFEFDYMMSRPERAVSQDERSNAQFAVEVLEPAVRLIESIGADSLDGCYPCSKCGLSMKGPQLLEWVQPSGEPSNEVLYWCDHCGLKHPA